MAFLRKSDYYTITNQTDLDLITDSTDSLLTQQEKSSKEELSSYLRHRYNVDQIFKDILTYSSTTQYNFGDLIEWSETAYSESSTYSEDDRVSQGGNIYEANQDINTPEAFDSAKWDLLAVNESLYYCAIPSLGNLPSNTFSYTTNLFTSGHDNIKGWNRENITLYFKRLGEEIRIYSSESDRTNNIDYVGVIEYDIDSITPPFKIEVNKGNNTTIELGGFVDIIGYISDDQEWSVVPSSYWVLGDNRNAKIVELIIDINLYHLYTRVQYRNIPEFVVNRYDGGTENQTAGAIGYLKMIQKGIVDMDLPRHYNDRRGQKITIDSIPKQNHSY